MKERTFRPLSGWGPTLLFVVVLILGPIVFITLAATAGVEAFWPTGFYVICAGLCVLLPGFGLFGCMPVQPNQARVLLLFGNYIGSVVESGFYWTNPLYNKKKISLRIRNFETGMTRSPEEKDATGRVLKKESRLPGRPSKVNDRDGNPIEISAVVVWRVVNTAEALFEVDDYEDFVAVQSEAALRNLATRHPYDSEDHEISLRANTVEISEQLRRDIQDRLEKAGVEVIEARISHLAYAPEIAAAMLQRQQAQAVVAARTKIVAGAVGMVEMALDELSKGKIVELDDERRAHMVSNLLVVLCGDRHVQPIVNSGTIY
jgi:regulator of protease activity HflC (stomatin/prohibitin superfamily)